MGDPRDGPVITYPYVSYVSLFVEKNSLAECSRFVHLLG